MESQANIFVPKYKLVTYLTPIGLLGTLALWIVLVLFASAIAYGWSYSMADWEFIGVPIIFLGVVAFESARKIIKEIEFDANKMVVRYYIGRSWAIDYQEINKVIPGKVIDAKKGTITLGGMTNGMELQSRVVDILRNRKIQHIDLNQTSENRVVVNKKIIGCALVVTLVIVVLLGVASKAGWLFWAFMLVVLFFLASFIFRKK